MQLLLSGRPVLRLDFRTLELHCNRNGRPQYRSNSYGSGNDAMGQSRPCGDVRFCRRKADIRQKAGVSSAPEEEIPREASIFQRRFLRLIDSGTSELRCAERLERIDIGFGLRLLVPLEIAERYTFGCEIHKEKPIFLDGRNRLLHV